MQSQNPNSKSNFKLTPLISLLYVHSAFRDDTNSIRDYITFRETMLLKYNKISMKNK